MITGIGTLSNAHRHKAALVRFLAPEHPELPLCLGIPASVQVFGRPHHERCRALRRPAPKSARARSRGEVWAAGGSQRYGDLIFAPVTVVGAKLARSDQDRVWRGVSRRRASVMLYER